MVTKRADEVVVGETIMLLGRTTPFDVLKTVPNYASQSVILTLRHGDAVEEMGFDPTTPFEVAPLGWEGLLRWAHKQWMDRWFAGAYEKFNHEQQFQAALAEHDREVRAAAYEALAADPHHGWAIATSLIDMAKVERGQMTQDEMDKKWGHDA